MNKTVIYFMIMMIGTMVLTNFVFATGETSLAPSAGCPACSSGSPQIKSYITWIDTILDTINQTKNNNPGVINGQGINIQRAKQESNERVTYASQRGVLSITQQALGVKSDMIALDKVHERISAVASSLINTKSQRTTAVDPSILTSLKAKTLNQVGTTKLLNGSGNWSDIKTYQDLMKSILSLHRQIVILTEGGSGAIITWQGYTSNKDIVHNIQSYYACAQTIPACSPETNILANNTASIQGYWADIIRAGQQIKSVFNAQYRKTPARSTNAIQFEDGFNQTWSDTKNIGLDVWSNIQGVWGIGANAGQGLDAMRPGGGNWKQWANSIKDKRAAKKAQQHKQQKQEEIIQQTKQAIADSRSLPTAQETQTTSLNNKAAYQHQDISYLQATLNAANDEILSDHLAMQESIAAADTTLINHQIPILTKQIYDAGQEIATAANDLHKVCEEHCSNLPSSCGKSVPTS